MRSTIAALLFASGALAAAADEPVKYASKEGKYAVSFPADTTVKKTTQDAGGIAINIATVEVQDRAYAVMFMTLPDAVKEVPAKTMLDGAEKGAVEKSGGKLVTSKEIAFGPKKYPGRDVLVVKDGNKVRTWIIFAGTKLYVVIVGGTKEFATGKDAQTFLDSFEITK